MLGLSDQAGARVRSTTAEESIEQWLEDFGTDRPLNEKGDRIVGHSTGLRCLDKITLGLQPARLYLLPAYTSVGKSQLAHQVALHVARHHGPVLLVALEMSDQELTGRALAMETGTPLETLATHAIDEAETDTVRQAARRQQSDPLDYMYGADGLTTSQIRSRAMQSQAQHGRLALIVADYRQLLQDSKGNNSSVEDQTLVSRNLKRMARPLDVPLLVPVQINRQASARRDQRPQLSDIRESGSWEQDADVVIALCRDELVHQDTDDRGMLEHLRESVGRVAGWLGVVRTRDGVEAVADAVLAGELPPAEVVAAACHAVGPVVETAFGLRRDADGAVAVNQPIGAQPLAAVAKQREGFDMPALA
jgi:replicative DNA helicase